MKMLKNSVFNLLGLGLPLFVAIFTIPVLIDKLGEARFGLLTLVWAVVSYFGLFDLGLGRALTQQLSVVFASKEHKKVGPLVATATILMSLLGILAGVVMALAASWGVGLIKDVPNRQEAINAVYAMALAMPFIVLTSGFRGILEARNAFGIVNLIRLPMGLVTFLGPLAVVLYAPSSRLDYVAWVLVIGRIIACAVHGYCAWRILPSDRSALVWRKDLIKVLGVSGGWMTVSNIVGPLMGYLDRFIVGAYASAQAVAFYATPQEVISKLSIIPSALMAVLFPQFAQSSSAFSKASIDMVERASSLITALCIPAFLLVALFSSEILTIWISSNFAQSSSEILTLFACGMLINSISSIPFTWLQATNHAKTVALIHIIELPFFSLLLWLGLREFGVGGAAMAWVARILLDSFLLWFAMAIRESRLAVVAKKFMFQSTSLAALIYITALSNFSIAIRSIIFLSVVIYFGCRLIGLVRLEDRAS